MRPLPLQGRHCCILSLILRPPPPTLSTKPRPPQYWHGTSTETVSSTEGRALLKLDSDVELRIPARDLEDLLPGIPACSAGDAASLSCPPAPSTRCPPIRNSGGCQALSMLRPRYRTRRSRRSNGSVAQPGMWIELGVKGSSYAARIRNHHTCNPAIALFRLLGAKRFGQPMSTPATPRGGGPARNHPRHPSAMDISLPAVLKSAEVSA
jgi:hypothetical protein